MGWAVLPLIALASAPGTPVTPVKGRQLCRWPRSRAACQAGTEGPTVPSGLKWWLVAQWSPVNVLVEALVLEESWEKGEEKQEESQALLPGCGWAAAAEGAHPSSWSMLGVEGRWERTEVGGSTGGERDRSSASCHRGANRRKGAGWCWKEGRGLTRCQGQKEPKAKGCPLCGDKPPWVSSSADLVVMLCRVCS